MAIAQRAQTNNRAMNPNLIKMTRPRSGAKSTLAPSRGPSRPWAGRWPTRASSPCWTDPIEPSKIMTVASATAVSAAAAVGASPGRSDMRSRRRVRTGTARCRYRCCCLTLGSRCTSSNSSSSGSGNRRPGAQQQQLQWQQRPEAKQRGQ